MYEFAVLIVAVIGLCAYKAFLRDRIERNVIDAQSNELIALYRENTRRMEIFEQRANGTMVRKDRWETGFRNIVTILFGPRVEFEIEEVVQEVRKLVESCGK